MLDHSRAEAVHDTDRYDAFISYSRRGAEAVSAALQFELERYGKPWYRQRRLRVFRDKANLAASPGLWTTIVEALSRSEWLILMASPEAATSEWVSKEVEWWIQHRSPDRILIALVDGEIAWTRDEFDWNRTNALPGQLAGVFRSAPNWIDVRSLASGGEPSSDGRPADVLRLGDVVAEFAAPIHDVPKDALIGAHVRERRRTRRTVQGVIALLSVLLLAAVAGGITAVTQRNVAVQQRDAALQQLRTASARQLIVQAQIALPQDPRTALKLAEAAYQLDPGPETRAVLAQQLGSTRYRKQLGGYGGGIQELTFSPDGHTLATASADGAVVLWDVTDPARPARLGQPLAAHSSWTTTVTFSPNGTVLATGGLDDTVSLWDVRDPARAVRIGQPLVQSGDVKGAAFSRDDRILAVINGQNRVNNQDSMVVLWDVTDPARPALLGSPLTGLADTVTAVTFSPTSDLLVTAVADGTVVVWDVRAPSRPVRLGESLAPGGPTGSLTFSPDGTTLVGSGGADAVTVWDMRDSRRPVRLGSTSDRGTTSVSDVAFASGGDVLVAAGQDGNVVLRRTGDPTGSAWSDETLAGHSDFDGGEGERAKGRVSAVAFSPDGNTLASAGSDRTVILWDVRDVSRPARVGPPPTGHTDALTAAAFRPGAPVLVTAGRDGTAAFWDVRDPSGSIRIGDPLPGHSNDVNAVAFSPDGGTMATAGQDGSVIVWDVRDIDRPARQIGDPLLGDGESANAVAFSRNGRTLAIADSDGRTLLWDVGDLTRPIRQLGPSLTAHIGAITSVDFSPTADILAAGTGDNVAVIWNVSDPARPVALGEPLTEHAELVAEVAFSPDGTILAIADGGGRVILHAVTDPARPIQIGQPLAASAPMAFSPDGTVLATSGADRTVDLWNVIDPARPARIGRPLAGHTDSVNAMSFSPDGTVLATASSDRTALLWRVPVENFRDPRAAACTVTDGGLDRAEWEREIPVLPWEESCP